MTFEERKRLTEESYEAWGSGDLDTLFAIYHPECEWDNRRLGLPDTPPVSRGHAEMAELRRVSLGSLPDIYPVALEIVDISESRVLVAGEWRARSEGVRAGALAAVPQYGQLIDFREGLISRVEFFTSPAEARMVADAA